MSLGELLRVRRMAKGLSQRQVSRATGISPGEVSLIENGKRGVSFRKIIALCDLYELDIRQAVAATRGDRL